MISPRCRVSQIADKALIFEPSLPDRKHRPPERKERLIRGTTRAFEEMGTKAESLQIIIHDVSKSNGFLRTTSI